MVKIVFNISMEYLVFEKFDEFCKQKDLKRSGVIRNLVKKYLIDQGVEIE